MDILPPLMLKLHSFDFFFCSSYSSPLENPRGCGNEVAHPHVVRVCLALQNGDISYEKKWRKIHL